MRKRLIAVTAVVILFGIGAVAQDGPVMRKLVTAPTGVMGKVVKGAPYAADEITESLQVLADGTRISHSSQVTVYRDGEGRVRRESPTQITIFDPVENVNYSLNPKTMTAVKSSMARATFSFTMGAPSENVAVAFDGPNVEIANAAVETTTRTMTLQLDKLKAELDTAQSAMIVDGSPANPQEAAAVKLKLAQAMEKVSTAGAAPSNTEVLGQQVIEGLTADGTRTTTTLEAGTIGNDRPIQTVSERWYSADLQTPVMTKHTDPRTGEETFRLVNVRRGEPGSDLFLLPPGYQLVTRGVAIPAARKEE